MQEWYSNLTRREQLMVMGAGALLVLTLIYALAINPLYSGSANTAARVAEKESTLIEMQAIAATLKRATQDSRGPSKGRGESIVIVIDRTTRERQLAGYLKRNQPDGPTSVRLRFEGAPFDELIDWVGELQNNYGMTTLSASFDQAAEPGRVNCSLVLDRLGI